MSCLAAERDFSFWMPMEVTKSSNGDMRIGGIATDESASDLQGEKVFIDGLDISYLKSRGAFNWNHQKTPDAILGEVDVAQKNGKQLYVEGFLYPHVDQAAHVYKLMKGMKESGSERKLGLSIEGKVKERDMPNGKLVKKAWVKNVAITYNPINQGTFVDLIKSFGDDFSFAPCHGDCSKCTFCEVAEKAEAETKTEEGAKGNVPSEEVKEAVAKAIQDEKHPGEETTVLSSDVDKALKAGYDIPATSGGVSGSALREEDQDKKEKVTTYSEDFLKKFDKK